MNNFFYKGRRYVCKLSHSFAPALFYPAYKQGWQNSRLVGAEINSSLRSSDRISAISQLSLILSKITKSLKNIKVCYSNGT